MVPPLGGEEAKYSNGQSTGCCTVEGDLQRCDDVAECVEVVRDSHGDYYVAASGYGLEKTFDSFEGWRGFVEKQEEGREEDTYKASFEVDALSVSSAAPSYWQSFPVYPAG